jgi:hypothetical protein
MQGTTDIVLGIINDKVLLIQDIKSKKTRYINASHVKLYNPRMSGSSEGDLPLSKKNETSRPVTRSKAQQLSEDTVVTRELAPQVVGDEARYAPQAQIPDDWWEHRSDHTQSGSGTGATLAAKD